MFTANLFGSGSPTNGIPVVLKHWNCFFPMFKKTMVKDLILRAFSRRADLAANFPRRKGISPNFGNKLFISSLSSFRTKDALSYFRSFRYKDFTLSKNYQKEVVVPVIKGILRPSIQPKFYYMLIYKVPPVIGGWEVGQLCSELLVIGKLQTLETYKPPVEPLLTHTSPLIRSLAKDVVKEKTNA